MKRIVVFCIAILLLAGCGGKEAAAPQVQMDARVQAATTAPAPTTAPAAEKPAEPTAAPAQVPAAAAEAPAEPADTGFAGALTARWEAEGLLEGLSPFPGEDVLDYYGIDPAACRSVAVFGDADGYTNEAVVVEAESAVLDEAEALLHDHLEAVKAQFRGYDAAALALAEKAVLVREGDAVLFVISPRADDMLKVFRDLNS